MSQENLWGGYISDKDEKLQAQEYAGIKFGLNSGAKIVLFGFTTATGQGGSAGNPAVEIGIKFGDDESKPINTRIYAPQKLYKGKNEITDVNSEDYKKALVADIMLKKGLLTHYAKAVGVTETDIQTAFNATPPTDFESLAKLYVNLVTPKMATALVDVFLHYQKDLKMGAEKTFLELPTNLAFGAFIVAHRPGNFEQVADYEVEVKQADDSVKIESITGGVAFKSPEGLLHPFKRDKKYAESTRAFQQTPANMAGPNPMGQPINPQGGFGQMQQPNNPASAPAEGTQAQDQDW